MLVVERDLLAAVRADLDGFEVVAADHAMSTAGIVLTATWRRRA